MMEGAVLGGLERGMGGRLLLWVTGVCRHTYYVVKCSLFLLPFQYRDWNVPQIWYVTPAGPLGNPLLIHGHLYSVEFYKSDEENPDGPVIKE